MKENINRLYQWYIVCDSIIGPLHTVGRQGHLTYWEICFRMRFCAIYPSFIAAFKKYPLFIVEAVRHDESML